MLPSIILLWSCHIWWFSWVPKELCTPWKQPILQWRPVETQSNAQTGNRVQAKSLTPMQVATQNV